MNSGPNVFIISCANKNQQPGEDEQSQLSIYFYVSAIVRAARAHSSYQPSTRRAGPNRPYPCDKCKESTISVRAYEKEMLWAKAVEMIMLSGDLTVAGLDNFTARICNDFDFTEWNRQDNYIALCYDCAPNYQRRNILLSQVDLSKRFNIIFSGVWLDSFLRDKNKKKRKWANITEYTAHYLQRQEVAFEAELTKIK